MKNKLDESTIRVLEVNKCGECFYFGQDCRIAHITPECEETGKKVEFDQIPPKSCPLLTVKEFVQKNYKCALKKGKE